MAIIDLGNGKVKILPAIRKVLVDTRTGLHLSVVYCDKGEEKYFKEENVNL